MDVPIPQAAPLQLPELSVYQQLLINKLESLRSREANFLQIFEHAAAIVLQLIPMQENLQGNLSR